jgi:uncharacterized protein YbaR (Trm112 family)
LRIEFDVVTPRGIDLNFKLQTPNSKLFFGGNPMSIDQELLDILACPKCKGEVQLENGGNSLVCHTCSLRYRIEDDIPVMLIDEAEKI